MNGYLGDFRKGDVVRLPFPTRGISGAAAARTTAGTIRVYKGNGTTESTAGITDSGTTAFDGKTGINLVEVDTGADAFYVNGADYFVVLDGATIDGVAGVTTIIGSFSLKNRSDRNLISGTVTPDGGNSATAFETDLASTTTDHYKDAWLTITSGALAGQTKKVTAYNGTTKIITVSGGFTGIPADGVTFDIINGE